jgi:hypothetical protein
MLLQQTTCLTCPQVEILTEATSITKRLVGDEWGLHACITCNVHDALTRLLNSNGEQDITSAARRQQAAGWYWDAIQDGPVPMLCLSSTSCLDFSQCQHACLPALCHTAIVTVCSP